MTVRENEDEWDRWKDRARNRRSRMRYRHNRPRPGSAPLPPTRVRSTGRSLRGA
jgi:hypothetical protein